MNNTSQDRFQVSLDNLPTTSSQLSRMTARKPLLSKTSSRPVLLKADKLVKSYGGKTVVNGLSIQVNKGEVVGLLGPNGAGKTTAFYMTIGLIKPDAGTVFF